MKSIDPSIFFMLLFAGIAVIFMVYQPLQACAKSLGQKTEKLMKQERSAQSSIGRMFRTLKEVKEDVDGDLLIIAFMGVFFIGAMIAATISLPEGPRWCKKTTFHEGSFYEARVRCPEEIRN